MAPEQLDRARSMSAAPPDGVFADRVDAGRYLARRLRHLRGQDVVVVGLPRGGVPVAAEVARELNAPLDVILVRKLGVPFQPELGMGAIGEGGVRVIDDDVVHTMRVTREQEADVEARERGELQRQARRFRGDREPVSLAGRVVVVVDDGVATGSTAYAACLVARAAGAARVVLAVPVAPVGWDQRLRAAADDLVCVVTPRPFHGIGRFYADFTQTSDEQVLAALARAVPSAASGGSADEDPIQVPVGTVELDGRLTVPSVARGVVVFAHGSGSSRNSPRNQSVARLLNRAGLATLLFDLLTPSEAGDRTNVFDIGLLATRLAGATAWLRQQPGFAALPVGWFGASTGAAAALWAAAEPESDVAAVVSRGGRPDLAGQRLGLVRAPTLLIVGACDPMVLDLNRRAANQLRCPSRLAVVPGATHLFEEPGTLEAAAEMARTWFLARLASAS